MTIRLTILRGPSTPEGTFGRARVDITPIDGFDLRSLELPWKDNAHGKSCVPAGTYSAVAIQSPHFEREVLLLQGVPGRSDVEIHPANWAGDEELGYYTQLRGCIALGFGIGVMPTPKGNSQRAVLKSGMALDAVLNAMGMDSEIEVVIINPVDATASETA